MGCEKRSSMEKDTHRNVGIKTQLDQSNRTTWRSSEACWLSLEAAEWVEKPVQIIDHNLVGGLEHEFYFFHILGRIIPTDFHMFQRD